MYLAKALTRIHASVDILSLGVTQTPRRRQTELDASVTDARDVHDVHADKAASQTAHKEHSTHSKHGSHATQTHTAAVHTNTHNSHAAHLTTAHTITPYAYAITRAGAKKLIACYDHCGLYIHEQLLACVEGELIAHAHAVYPLFTRGE
eukprot:GDKK01040439.1.p1 GENE.GDKK01040439.1~~GDKK01040439.1.p1  ORF type:complete len:159 (+),score=11.81 GDKK01040439.1:31-477(+)